MWGLRRTGRPLFPLSEKESMIFLLLCLMPLMYNVGSYVCPLVPRLSASFLRASETSVAPPASVPIATQYKLSVAEKTKTILSSCSTGVLSTLSSSPRLRRSDDHDDVNGRNALPHPAPFGTHVDYVLDGDGYPVFLVNEESEHSRNLMAWGGESGEDLVSIFVQFGEESVGGGLGGGVGGGLPSSAGSGTGSGMGQEALRCTVVGTHSEVPREDPDYDQIRNSFCLRHPWAEGPLESPKFAFVRITPLQIYYVGSFGVLSTWVDLPGFFASEADVVASESFSILRKVNREHRGDLSLVARHLLGIERCESAVMTGVDRLGIDVRVSYSRAATGRKITDVFRLGFLAEVVSAEDAKSEILKVFQEAWEREEGVDWGDEGEDWESWKVDFPVFKLAGDAL